MIKGGISVRQATQQDSPLLVTVCRQCYTENFRDHWIEGGLEWYLDKEYGIDRFKSDLDNPHINYFIAFSDSEPVGFMKLNLNSNFPGQPPESGMEIEKIYFRPHHQGKGLGKNLLSIAFALAKKLSKEIIWLGVIDTNHQAIAFYKKIGFEIRDKTSLDVPYFKEELKGMWRMSFRFQ